MREIIILRSITGQSGDVLPFCAYSFQNKGTGIEIIMEQ
jgi:hypothetical protein